MKVRAQAFAKRPKEVRNHFRGELANFFPFKLSIKQEKWSTANIKTC